MTDYFKAWETTKGLKMSDWCTSTITPIFMIVVQFLTTGAVK